MPSNPKIIGVENGIAQAEIIGSKFETKGLYEKISGFFQGADYWSRESFIPDFQVKLEYVKLYKKAILTDFLSFSPHLMACPFMINKKVIDIFSRFEIQKHFLYSMKLYDSTKCIDSYSLFYCPLLGYDVVDFKESEFVRKIGILDIKDIDISSFEDFKTKMEEHSLLEAKKLVLNEKFNKKLDFFKVRVLGGMYISERLKKALEEARIKGINILEAKDPEIIVDRK